jgi:hypothetical protein
MAAPAPAVTASSASAAPAPQPAAVSGTKHSAAEQEKEHVSSSSAAAAAAATTSAQKSGGTSAGVARFESIVSRILPQVLSDSKRHHQLMQRRRATTTTNSKPSSSSASDSTPAFADIKQPTDDPLTPHDVALLTRHNTFRPPYLKVVAPMVRYSKLPFRLLANRWGADLCFTPMIVASSFARAQMARDSEFATVAPGLVTQPFANHNSFIVSASTTSASSSFVSADGSNTAAAAALRSHQQLVKAALARLPTHASPDVRQLIYDAASAAASKQSAAEAGSAAGNEWELSSERPVIVQFAANRADELCAAAMHVAPYVDGVDINW